MQPPDHTALMDGVRALIAAFLMDRAGRPALGQLLTTAGDALGAAGMTLSEHHDSGGQVVAATGTASGTLGRPMGTAAPAGASTWEHRVDPGGGGLPAQLHGRGVRRVAGTRVPRRHGPDSLLCAYFATDQPCSADHHAMLQFLGACAAVLYACEAAVPSPAPAAGSDDPDLFLAVTSHELRTPVTVIKGFADTLDQHWDTLDAAARRDAVRVIRQRADELARLVDRLLATAVDASAPARAPFDPVRALRDAVDGLRAELRQRLRVALPATLPPAYGHRASIPAVLTELVTNAAKYSTGEVELAATADERTVLIQVSDAGPGVTPEPDSADHASPESGDRADAGAGLGLHLVRRIVERQHGWVSLRPRRSGGTVAEVRLLRADAPVTDES